MKQRCLAVGLMVVAATVGAATGEPPEVARGREIAHDVYRGNCLACHRIPGDPAAVTLATIGPPLVKMRARYPDAAALRARVWDPTTFNPMTVMPPFGRHGVLTEAEIDDVIAYISRY